MLTSLLVKLSKWANRRKSCSNRLSTPLFFPQGPILHPHNYWLILDILCPHNYAPSQRLNRQENGVPHTGVLEVSEKLKHGCSGMLLTFWAKSWALLLPLSKQKAQTFRYFRSTTEPQVHHKPSDDWSFRSSSFLWLTPPPSLRSKLRFKGIYRRLILSMTLCCWDATRPCVQATAPPGLRDVAPKLSSAAGMYMRTAALNFLYGCKHFVQAQGAT